MEQSQERILKMGSAFQFSNFGFVHVYQNRTDFKADDFNVMYFIFHSQKKKKNVLILLLFLF